MIPSFLGCIRVWTLHLVLTELAFSLVLQAPNGQPSGSNGISAPSVSQTPQLPPEQNNTGLYSTVLDGSSTSNSTTAVGFIPMREVTWEPVNEWPLTEYLPAPFPQNLPGRFRFRLSRPGVISNDEQLVIFDKALNDFALYHGGVTHPHRIGLDFPPKDPQHLRPWVHIGGEFLGSPKLDFVQVETQLRKLFDNYYNPPRYNGGFLKGRRPREMNIDVAYEVVQGRFIQVAEMRMQFFHPPPRTIHSMPWMPFPYRLVDDQDPSHYIEFQEHPRTPHGKQWPRYGRYEWLELLDNFRQAMLAIAPDSQLSYAHHLFRLHEEVVTETLFTFEALSEAVTYRVLGKILRTLHTVIENFGAFTTSAVVHMQGQVVARIQM